MNETPLYQAVQSRRAEGGRTLACVLDGECAGEQLLLCEGVPVWQCVVTTIIVGAVVCYFIKNPTTLSDIGEKIMGTVLQ